MQPKKLDHISVKNENAVFGIMRDAGTTIYDKANKKTYLLLERALSLESLASFDAKKEMGGAVVGFQYIITVGDLASILTGYESSIPMGSASPNEVSGFFIRNTMVENGINTFSLVFGSLAAPDTGGYKLHNADTIDINIEGYGTVTVTFDVEAYKVVDEALKTYMVSQIGNDLIITIVDYTEVTSFGTFACVPGEYIDSSTIVLDSALGNISSTFATSNTIRILTGANTSWVRVASSVSFNGTNTIFTIAPVTTDTGYTSVEIWSND